MFGRWGITLVLISGCFYKPEKSSDRQDASVNTDGAPPLDSSTEPNLVFVTARTVNPGTLGGLAQADALCMGAATGLGLPQNHYVAWLSTTQISARERLGTARGWVRPDGLPFADQRTDILAGRILYPAKLDETKAVVSSNDAILTGTLADGSLAVGENCGDYTTATSAKFGRSDAGAPTWTAAGTTGCNQQMHLYCFGIDQTFPLAPLPIPTKIAFVSDGLFVPNTMGRAGMDTVCQNEAITHGFATGVVSGNSFLSMLALGVDSALGRVDTATPWFRPDGVEVTRDWSTFKAPLDVTGSGSYTSDHVVTGATSPSANGSTNCSDWFVNGDSIVGEPERSIGVMFNNNTVEGCNSGHRVYCAQMQ
jgi:hypothetical protein